MPKRAPLYAAAIFLSSSLLFLIEPMAGKRLLPLLGGSAAVWTTCLVFFQSALLLGYLCAHWIATQLRPRSQALAYGLLLIASLAQIALNLNPHPHASTARPIVSVLVVLSGLIGIPFLVLSATSSLLQAWYARGPAGTNRAGMAEAARPPYRLFAVSNFGSLLALVIYPVFIEPNFSLRTQTLAWAVGFLVFTIVCAGISVGASSTRELAVESSSAAGAGHNGHSSSGATALPADAVEKPAEKEPTALDRMLWLLLAAGGALLLSAVTSHLSQNIAAIPLLWILPLTIYLLTFVIAFNGRFYWRWVVVPILVVALAGTGYLIANLDTDLSLRKSVLSFCGMLFVACLFCHGELYRRRPEPRFTTQYYLLIAAGGALGSMFVGLCAPYIFAGSYEMAWSLVYTAALAILVLWRAHWFWRLFWPAVTAAMVVVVVLQARAYRANAIVEVRSFYGSMRVLQESDPQAGMFRTLVHGTIQHGTQYFGTEEDRTSPTTYYVHTTGVGLALDFCCKNRPRRVAVVGLGAGTLASYGNPGDVFRFYEIDSRVETIAKNVFTYLRDSKAKIELVEGDARLSMEGETPQQYDVIAVDAFSGDAIPVHLLTAEALRLYQRHLRPGGILAFHVSNSFVDLGPVVAQEAKHAGMSAVMVSTTDDDYGGYAADWVLVTSNLDFLASPKVKAASANIELKPGLRLWTDDYSSLWPIMKWTKKQEDGDDSESSGTKNNPGQK
ncbi:MAG TPA: fused MFS/spermidine synthase [Candidatus Angelobacter sp.]|nr:fused MFS/spermidine synthase [Candidatus Angelobacter sp.]